MSSILHEKKKALLDHKAKILQDIKYYESRIDDFRGNPKNNFYEGDNSSSDSEDEFPLSLDTSISIPQLKLQQAKLKTCLQATQELTSLTILQSEVNVLVEDPKLEGETPVTEAGTWKEVTAECRIDLVLFTITFFMHIPDRKFAPPSYRGLRVVPVKNTHEVELAKSVLHSLKLPSDIIEVLKSYAVGYRSRRTTLARLANRYTNALFMEPHPEGGFVLKCADLLEISWRLENKWSPVAPFHHRMKFDLEYMDESYIKTITQAHKQLLDPAIQTDERTLLLAKIISTCLEARGPVDPESDLESKTTEKDNDIEKRDSEVMAPPKSIPKKPKARSKDSLNQAGHKRSTPNDDDKENNTGAKRIKNNVNVDNGPKKSIVANVGTSNARKSKMSDVGGEGFKRKKTNDDVSDKNANIVADRAEKELVAVKERDGNDDIEKNSNIKSKNKIANPNSEDKDGKNQPKNKAVKGNSKVNKNGDNKSKKKADNDTANTELGKEIMIYSKNKALRDAGNTEIDKDSNTKPKSNAVKNTGSTESGKGNVKSKSKVLKDAGHTEQDKDGNTKPKAKDLNDVGTSEVNKESTSKNKKIAKESYNIDGKDSNTKAKVAKSGIAEHDKDMGNVKPKNKVVNEAGNSEVKITKANKNFKSKTSNIPNSKNDKVINSNENTENVAKKSEKQNTKVNAQKSSNTKTKNSDQNSNKQTDSEAATVKENNVQDKDKVEVINKRKVAKYDNQTVTKVTEKNATNNKIKDKISPITKETDQKKVLSGNLVSKQSKVVTNSINNDTKLTKGPSNTFKNLPNKIAPHRSALKVRSTQSNNAKIFNPGNEKENSGQKNSKIQIKLLPISESSLKKNPLRISPRIIPSTVKSTNRFKSTSTSHLMKHTNIPRLMKKSAPKSLK